MFTAGKGDIVPVGATSFEFMVPEGAPVSITPAVGTVNPGEVSHPVYWDLRYRV